MSFNWDVPIVDFDLLQCLQRHRTGRNTIVREALITRKVVKVVCSHLKTLMTVRKNAGWRTATALSVRSGQKTFRRHYNLVIPGHLHPQDWVSKIWSRLEDNRLGGPDIQTNLEKILCQHYSNSMATSAISGWIALQRFRATRFSTMYMLSSLQQPLQGLDRVGPPPLIRI